MKTITLSKENIYDVSYKQEGYGRQGLYLDLYNLDGAPDQRVYWGSTFPNPEEHWNLHTDDEVFPKMRETGGFDGNGDPILEEVSGEYTDCSGNDVPSDRIFKTIFDGIVAMVTGDEREVKEEYDEEYE